jgi:mRNA-degrading endonuclease toxin of MazEF toxin-antitoxin module
MVDLRAPRSTLGTPRVANASMIMTYDRSRIVKKAGSLRAETRAAVDRALAIHSGSPRPDP